MKTTAPGLMLSVMARRFEPSDLNELARRDGVRIGSATRLFLARHPDGVPLSELAVFADWTGNEVARSLERLKAAGATATEIQSYRRECVDALSATCGSSVKEFA